MKTHSAEKWSTWQDQMRSWGEKCSAWSGKIHLWGRQDKRQYAIKVRVQTLETNLATCQVCLFSQSSVFVYQRLSFFICKMKMITIVLASKDYCGNSVKWGNTQGLEWRFACGQHSIHNQHIIITIYDTYVSIQNIQSAKLIMFLYSDLFILAHSLWNIFLKSLQKTPTHIKGRLKDNSLH